MKINKKISIFILMVIIGLICSIFMTVSNADSEPIIKVEYNYDENTNEVTASIVSNVELKDTKPTWKLSADKKIYTKVFTGNTSYSTPVQTIGGKTFNTTINVNQIKKATIKVEYKYDESSNTVTATITSNTKLKNTKPTWSLSKDQRVYTKKFETNENYSTPVQNVNGEILNATISINQIKKAAIKVEYKYDEGSNTVTAAIISDTKLKNTKPTWSLSGDQKVYTKKFKTNENYSTPVVDINGNVINATINITQIKIAKLTVKYSYNDQNNTVLASIVSDAELKHTKPTWSLSSDKKTYTKTFYDNTAYSTPVVDVYGNTINITININQIDKKAPEIKLEYKYNANDTVTISMKSNEKMKDTKPTWTLSNDKLTYSKTFSTNQEYTTPVQDLYGNTTNVKIVLKKKKRDYTQSDNSKISVGYMYTSYGNVIVQITSTVKLVDTKPTWTLSQDGYTYTKSFTENTKYTTPVQDVNGLQKNVEIIVDFYNEIKYESGTYGVSGAKAKGVQGGTNLEYLKFGNGPNVFFATFCVHGYEDSWSKDGSYLVEVANKFYNRLISDKDTNLANKWTIYVLKQVNPDGVNLGYTNNGPGRTTVYSKVGKGIDINRSWQTDSYYKRYTDNRNYNGTAGFQAYEAEYLRNFLLSHKSQSGKTVLVDLHGWENQLIGDSQIGQYYKQQYTTCATNNYGKYGTQYLISWARQNLGAKSMLVELPKANSQAQANSMGLADKYINATLNMLRGI